MPRKKLNPILGEVSFAQLSGFYTLIISFCMVTGLLVAGFGLVDRRILAAVAVILYFTTLFFIYVIRKSMIRKLDSTGEQLKVMSTTDELTRAFNRRHFNTLFTRELERSRRYGKELCCLMLDIDNFKAINSRFGHETGDEILQDMSDLMKDNLRITDIYARYGDNRFVCLLPETNMEQTVNFSKRLRRLLEGKKLLHRDTREEISITISIGVVASRPYVDKDIDNNKIISLAEEALEKAKKSGGNSIQCYPEAPAKA